MITKDVTRIKQAKEVIEGQLSVIDEIFGADEKEMPPAIHSMVSQSMMIIAMAVQSLTKD